MNAHNTAILLKSTGAHSIAGKEEIQALWSGYGMIERVFLTDGEVESVIVKNVCPPSQAHHPRGWSSDRSHERKLNSYEVEMAWYTQWSPQCGDACRIPRCLGAEQTDDTFFMVLEDLDAAGFPIRKTRVRKEEVETCLRWLAEFHAIFLGKTPENLWPQGCYWHLETRPDELEVLDDSALKSAASAIDQTLSQCTFQTFVHGDAKLANFCFSKNGRVAVVDFQYVGGGCGMKDVAYFLGSCLDETSCEQQEAPLLDVYFQALRGAVIKRGRTDAEAIEADWRRLYPFAWADFHRFLKGWSPGHWKINSYSERVCRSVLTELGF